MKDEEHRQKDEEDEGVDEQDYAEGIGCEGVDERWRLVEELKLWVIDGIGII